MASFSKIFKDTFTEEGIKTVEVEVKGVIYRITPEASGNTACGYTPFTVSKTEGHVTTHFGDREGEEGCINIPGGQIQVCWEEIDGEVTDDLSVFFFDYEDADRTIYTEYV